MSYWVRFARSSHPDRHCAIQTMWWSVSIGYTNILQSIEELFAVHFACKKKMNKFVQHHAAQLSMQAASSFEKSKAISALAAKSRSVRFMVLSEGMTPQTECRNARDNAGEKCSI
jgi:hypothetical protein